jgi:type IX secretion system PorP/SprF family membrane protein
LANSLPAVQAQLLVHNYPIAFTQYAQQMPFYNPAATAATTNWEISVESRRNTGFWHNNQTSLGYGAFRIQPKNSANSHGLGMSVYNEKEGNYLKRYRSYLQYAYHVAINSSWQASAGLSLGIMTYQVGSNDYDGGGSSSTFDGSIGFLLAGKGTYLGLTIAQIPEKKVQPIFEQTELSRYYQIMIGKDFELNPDLLLKNNINTRIFSGQSPDIFLQSGLSWKDMIGFYGLYRWDRQVSFLLGLEKIEWEGLHLKAFLSYDIAINNDQRYQAFEISLQCVKPKKETTKNLKKRKKRKR